jgi:hypothetical protein
MFYSLNVAISTQCRLAKCTLTGLLIYLGGGGGGGGVKNFPDISRRKKGSKKFSGQTPVKLTFKYIFQINTCKITGKTIELKITKSFLVQWVKHIFRTNTSKIKVSK